ncbi:hypothetical protein CKO15_12805 [Halorhodospira abdelmalekii]|nr:hypothetical protein [Halorhodospira abdelmalekii]
MAETPGRAADEVAPGAAVHEVAASRRPQVALPSAEAAARLGAAEPAVEGREAKPTAAADSVADSVVTGTAAVEPVASTPGATADSSAGAADAAESQGGLGGLGSPGRAGPVATERIVEGVEGVTIGSGSEGRSTAALASYGWSELEQCVADCHACRLAEGRTQTVFGVGDRSANLVLVGEGPGKEEDRRGEPFVGRAGQLLDAMLAAIDRGRERGGVYICNIVKCRPPGNRDPRPDEVAACSGYLRRQLELLEPRLIVALGRVAAQKLLNSTASLADLRGQTHTYTLNGGGEIPVWVTYHPAYLLRSPAEKAKSWHDLKRIRANL